MTPERAMARKKSADPKRYKGNTEESVSSSSSGACMVFSSEDSDTPCTCNAPNIAHNSPTAGAEMPVQVPETDAEPVKKSRRVEEGDENKENEDVHRDNQGIAGSSNADRVVSRQVRDAMGNTDNQGIAGTSNAAQVVGRQVTEGSSGPIAGPVDDRFLSDGLRMEKHPGNAPSKPASEKEKAADPAMGEKGKSRYEKKTVYKPYKPGDVVIDSENNTKAKSVLPQEKSRELPTLSLPILSVVQNCCKWDLLSYGVPPFPRNLPPLANIEYVVCYDVMSTNASDPSAVWRFMDAVSHRQEVKWLRSSHTMTTSDRTTVIGLKNFNGGLVTHFMTFCRVEKGI